MCCVSEVKVVQSRPTLCDSMDCSPPGFSVRGILQARILEWVVISISRCYIRAWLNTSPLGIGLSESFP